MSILIKGMEMPKGRPICVVIDAAGQARRYDLNNDRYADNELLETISVPPHGRLGDLDELYKEALKRSETNDGYYNCLDPVISCYTIDHAPTIIPEEEGET